MKLSAVRQHNKAISVTHERLVVFGGTQGIGAAVACRFAEAGAEVWIVGRSEAKAERVLEKCTASSAKLKIDPPPAHTFLQADLSLVSEVKRVTKDVRTRAGTEGIDYLVMSQGGPPNGTYVLTSEDHEQHFVVQVLSRFIIAQDLAGNPETSIVKKAVMSIMAPWKSVSKLDIDDLELRNVNAKGGYGIFTAMVRDATVMDAFTEGLAKENSNVIFTHVYPGTVKTDFARNSQVPWYMSLLVSAYFIFGGTTPEDYSEIPFYLLAHPDGRTQARRDMFIDEKCSRLQQRVSDEDAELRKKICRKLPEIAKM